MKVPRYRYEGLSLKPCIRMQISEILCKGQCLGKEHHYPFNVFVVPKVSFPRALS